MAGPREKRDPYLWEALVSILALVIIDQPGHRSLRIGRPRADFD